MFQASGPKADAIIRHLLDGGWTTDEICAATGASASRVSECRWALEAAGIAYPPVARKAKATPVVAAPALSVAEQCARAWGSFA